MAALGALGAAPYLHLAPLTASSKTLSREPEKKGGGGLERSSAASGHSGEAGTGVLTTMHHNHMQTRHSFLGRKAPSRLFPNARVLSTLTKLSNCGDSWPTLSALQQGSRGLRAFGGGGELVPAKPVHASRHPSCDGSTGLLVRRTGIRALDQHNFQQQSSH